MTDVYDRRTGRRPGGSKRGKSQRSGGSRVVAYAAPHRSSENPSLFLLF